MLFADAQWCDQGNPVASDSKASGLLPFEHCHLPVQFVLEAQLNTNDPEEETHLSAHWTTEAMLSNSRENT